MYAVYARRKERRDVHVVEALGGAAEGSYEQEAAAVEEDEAVPEEMEQKDERGVAKRPDLNELLANRCAGKGRIGIEWNSTEEATAAHRPLGKGRTRRRPSESSGRVPLQGAHTMLLPCRGTHLPKTAKTAKTALANRALALFFKRINSLKKNAVRPPTS